MKLNPLDIYNKEFNKSAFGYNKDQVDEFIDDIGVAYERLLKDLNNLQKENKELKEKIGNHQDMEEKLQKTLDSMQDTVSNRIKQAENEARMIVKEARVKADRIEDKTRNKVAAEKRKLEQLREQRNFFKIRFQTLLESHLEMLKEEENSAQNKNQKLDYKDEINQSSENEFNDNLNNEQLS